MDLHNSAVHVANVKRMIDLVDAEVAGTERLIANCCKEHDYIEKEPITNQTKETLLYGDLYQI